MFISNRAAHSGRLFFGAGRGNVHLGGAGTARDDYPMKAGEAPSGAEYQNDFAVFVWHISA